MQSHASLGKDWRSCRSKPTTFYLKIAVLVSADVNKLIAISVSELSQMHPFSVLFQN